MSDLQQERFLVLELNKAKLDKLPAEERCKLESTIVSRALARFKGKEARHLALPSFDIAGRNTTEDVDIVDFIVTHLKNEDLIIFCLFLAGYKMEEIVVATCICRSTAYEILARAKEKLAREWKKL